MSFDIPSVTSHLKSAIQELNEVRKNPLIAANSLPGIVDKLKSLPSKDSVVNFKVTTENKKEVDDLIKHVKEVLEIASSVPAALNVHPELPGIHQNFQQVKEALEKKANSVQTTGDSEKL